MVSFFIFCDINIKSNKNIRRQYKKFEYLGFPVYFLPRRFGMYSFVFESWNKIILLRSTNRLLVICNSVYAIFIQAVIENIQINNLRERLGNQIPGALQSITWASYQNVLDCINSDSTYRKELIMLIYHIRFHQTFILQHFKDKQLFI